MFCNRGSVGLCFDNKVNISVLVTVGIFLLGYIVNRMIEENERRRVRNKYLLALLQEIEINIASVRVGEREWPSVGELSTFLRAGLEKIPPVFNRPHISFSYIDTVFRARIDVIQDLNSIIIKNLVEFYGTLQSISGDIKALEGKAYDTISVAGRESLFATIKLNLSLCAAQGRATSDGIRLYLRLPYS